MPRKGLVEIQRTIGHDHNGKAIKKSFYGKTREEALAKWYIFENDIVEKENKKIKTPFNEWATEWLWTYKAPNVKPSTFDTTYRRPTEKYIIPQFKSKPLQDITPIELQAFLNKHSRFSRAFVDKLVLCLNGIFETAIDNGILDRNPARKLKKTGKEAQERRTYTKDTVERFKAFTFKYKTSFLILICMGLRCSELCALKWKDIDLDKKIMTVASARTIQNGAPKDAAPKSKSSIRRLPIPDFLINELREKKSREKARQTDYVHLHHGNPSRPDHFNERELKLAYDECGVPNEQRLTAHELRHTCGTLLYEETHDIFHVSKFLGHSDLSVTAKIYVHSSFGTASAINVDFAPN